MKKLEELGISPPPWSIRYLAFPAEYGGGRTVDGVVSRNGGTRIDWNMGIADSRLVAAAPRMYKAGREVIIAKCRRCVWCNRNPENNCEFSGKCSVKNLRAALAEAAGEAINN